MQRALTSTRWLMAMTATVVLTAATIPLTSGFDGGGNRPVMPIGCPPAC